jgi:hypothetical protein
MIIVTAISVVEIHVMNSDVVRDAICPHNRTLPYETLAGVKKTPGHGVFSRRVTCLIHPHYTPSFQRRVQKCFTPGLVVNHAYYAVVIDTCEHLRTHLDRGPPNPAPAMKRIWSGGLDTPVLD